MVGADDPEWLIDMPRSTNFQLCWFITNAGTKVYLPHQHQNILPWKSFSCAIVFPLRPPVKHFLKFS
jgi:hypothetical protein